MFKIHNSTTEDGWEEWSLEKVQHTEEQPDAGPVISFATELETRLMLGRYRYHNLTIELSMMPLYGERHDSACLSFIIGDQRIDTHGIYRKADAIEIPTDRDGTVVELSGPLPSDFYAWLQERERTMTWDD